MCSGLHVLADQCHTDMYASVDADVSPFACPFLQRCQRDEAGHPRMSLLQYTDGKWVWRVGPRAAGDAAELLNALPDNVDQDSIVFRFKGVPAKTKHFHAYVNWDLLCPADQDARLWAVGAPGCMDPSALASHNDVYVVHDVVHGRKQYVFRIQTKSKTANLWAFAQEQLVSSTEEVLSLWDDWGPKTSVPSQISEARAAGYSDMCVAAEIAGKQAQLAVACVDGRLVLMPAAEGQKVRRLLAWPSAEGF